MTPMRMPLCVFDLLRLTRFPESLSPIRRVSIHPWTSAAYSLQGFELRVEADGRTVWTHYLLRQEDFAHVWRISGCEAAGLVYPGVLWIRPLDDEAGFMWPEDEDGTLADLTRRIIRLSTPPGPNLWSPEEIARPTLPPSDHGVEGAVPLPPTEEPTP